jgi:N-acetylglutamate synthase-like GNAT family acetyltransferase
MTADYDQAVRQHLIDLYEEGGELHALIEMFVETGPTYMLARILGGAGPYDAEARHLQIENIAVRPDQQGKGIGDRLLRHAEAVAASMNIREVQLLTGTVAASNIAFYLKRGYEEFDRRTITHPNTGSPATLVFMRKTLPSTR